MDSGPRLKAHPGMTASGTAPLPLPLAAHEVEVAAFVGLQNGLVEEMGVAAACPFRRRCRLERGASLVELGVIDQEIYAALFDLHPDHLAHLHHPHRSPHPLLSRTN